MLRLSKYSLLIFILLVSVLFAKAQRPSGFPITKSTGWVEYGYLQNDSGFIPAPRDTNWTPRFPGTSVYWQHAGVDTATWVFNNITLGTGQRWIKQLSSNSIPNLQAVSNVDSIVINHGIFIQGLTVGTGHYGNIYNTAYGVTALSANTTGAENTAIGYRALHNNTVGEDNLAAGLSALDSNTTGSYNIAVGTWALRKNNASFNTSVGQFTTVNNTTGSLLSAFGEGALHDNTTGARNAAYGCSSMFKNTTGNYNSAFGTGANANNTTSSYNTAVGYNSLHVASGDSNTVVGYQSGNALTGYGNLFLGYMAGAYVTTGNNLLIIGSGDMGSYANDTSKAIIVGYQNFTTSSQRLKVNGKLQVTNLPTSGTYYKTVRMDATGNLYGSDTTATAAQVYPGAGIANSTGSAWGTSYGVSGTGTTVMLTASPTTTGTLTGATSTWSGTHTITTNGALSAPAITGTGTWITGGSATTTKPYLLIEPTGTTSTGWSTNGTGLGINAASGFTGNLIDAQIAGTSYTYIDKYGVTTNKNNASYPIFMGAVSGYGQYPGLWLGQVTPSISNFTFLSDGTQSILNTQSSIDFRVSNSTKWTISSSGHLITGSDNSYDIGASGATRPRTGYFGTSIVNPLLIGGTGTTSSLTYKTTTGVGTTGADHIFQVGNNGATEAMRILNNGNIGIGTTSPNTKLEVIATSNAGGIRATSNGTASPLIGLYNGSNERGGIGLVMNAGNFASGTAVNDIVAYSYGNSAYKFHVATGSSPSIRMTIDGTGSVGIGTSTPASTLDIKGANTIDGLRVRLTGQTPYLAQFYNDAYSTGTSVFQYFAFNTGNFTMGAPAAKVVSLYTNNHYSTPEISILANSDVALVSNAGNVGIGTTSPNSTLHTNGSFATAYRAITALRTLDATDYTIDCTSGSFTVTLPTAIGITGRIYTIKNSGAGSITVSPYLGGPGIELIDGASSYTLGTQYKYVTLQSNNAGWIVIGNN